MGRDGLINSRWSSLRGEKGGGRQQQQQQQWYNMLPLQAQDVDAGLPATTASQYSQTFY
jgi:hypothetical protein